MILLLSPYRQIFKNRFPRSRGRGPLFFTRFDFHPRHESWGFLVQNKDFLDLTITNIFAQAAFAFLTLILVTSVFAVTKSNFGVLGVVIEAILGYVNILIFGGMLLVSIGGMIAAVSFKWKF